MNERYDIQNEPTVFSKELSDLFLQQENPADLIALYWFYYYTAKWQSTDAAKAVNTYVAQGLKWSVQRVIRVGKQLKALGLIEKRIERDGQRITGHFVFVRFGTPCTRKATVKVSHTVAFANTNALRLLNKSFKGGAAETFDPTDLPAGLAKDKRVRKTWAEFVQARKEKKVPLTPLACKKLWAKMAGRSTEEIVGALNTAIECGWRGVFFRQPAARHSLRQQSHRQNVETRGLAAKFPIAAVQLNTLSEDPQTVWRVLDGLQQYYMRIPTSEGLDVPGTNLQKFVREWVAFLAQRKDMIRSDWDMVPGKGLLWNLFIKEQQSLLGVNFRTGRKVT